MFSFNGALLIQHRIYKMNLQLAFFPCRFALQHLDASLIISRLCVFGCCVGRNHFHLKAEVALSGLFTLMGDCRTCRLNSLLAGEPTRLLLSQGSTRAALRTKTADAPATVELSSEGLLKNESLVMPV